MRDLCFGCWGRFCSLSTMKQSWRFLMWNPLVLVEKLTQRNRMYKKLKHTLAWCTLSVLYSGHNPCVLGTWFLPRNSSLMWLLDEIFIFVFKKCINADEHLLLRWNKQRPVMSEKEAFTVPTPDGVLQLIVKLYMQQVSKRNNSFLSSVQCSVLCS